MSGYRDDSSPTTPTVRFWKAVLAGTTIAALVPFALVMVVLMSSDVVGAEDLSLVLLMVAMAIGFPLLVVLVAATVVGLPTSFVLKQTNAESAATYVCVGAVLGTATMLLIFGLPVSWLVLIGAAAGAVAAYVWWLHGDRRPAE